MKKLLVIRIYAAGGELIEEFRLPSGDKVVTAKGSLTAKLNEVFKKGIIASAGGGCLVMQEVFD